jgi:ribosomal protein S18 acetylase RimI-like enzyme
VTGPADIHLLPLSTADEKLVDRIFDQLTSYSILAEGVTKVANAAMQFLTELPPGCGPAAKHVFAVMKDGQAVGLVDLVDGYPEKGTVFVGLLAIVEGRQGQGIGRAAERLIEEFVRGLGAAKLRLAVVEGNAVGQAFWEKAGFRDTGERKPYAGEARRTTARLMEKLLKTV